MRSLFIVGLPRSLTTRIYDLVRQALSLRAPSFVSDGEILNADRYVLAPAEHGSRGRKYLTETRDAADFAAAHEYLDVATQREGHIYKDVVNPFVLAAWPCLGEFKLLRIRRDVAEVGLALMRRGEWDWPRRAAPPQLPRLGAWSRSAIAAWLTDPRWVRRRLAGYPLDAVLAGLLSAEATLDRLAAAVSVEFDDLVASEESLASALRRLYPDVPPAELAYIDPQFRTDREQQLRLRETPAYREVRRRVDALRKAG